MLVSCGESAWNNPYPETDKGKNILYSSFSERPKHLDPARSYSSNEVVFTGQIYETPLQYHYLKRPYQLIPLTAVAIPEARYFDSQDKPLLATANVDRIAYTLYDIEILPGIQYQPHPAFAKDNNGNYRYLDLTEPDLRDKFTLADFSDSGSRELLAEDYVYQIKRLAHPKLSSPILGLMSEYIDGLGEYAVTLKQAETQLQQEKGDGARLDLRDYDLSGVQVLGPYRYRVKIKGKYPQFLYWLAMPFFAPIPYEADLFYQQIGMDKKNLTLDWYPVGTGPYLLSENNPNLRMTLEKNPNFHGETYPTEGEPGDAEQGLLADAGQALPLIDKVVYSLEKEDIPSWNKFLQGYYDASGINSDSFDQAISFSSHGDPTLSESMREKGINLLTGVGTSTFYMGFNMRDPVLGGLGDTARKLRQAISIALDYEEYISIFLNGRGITAQGPIPPGIFGFKDGAEGINPVVFDWVDGKIQRKSLTQAKRLLVEAGYPNGREAKTGKPLLIYFDTTTSGPDDKARLDWFRKQFQRIDVQLEVRGTDYNRFQDKILKGTAQMFGWGWNADYPDPENFLFLLYGPNAKVEKNGENAANYANPNFDKLFERMKNMDNGPERQKVIDTMVQIVRDDSPWIWGLHPLQYGLNHAWYKNAKPNLMANNSMKYKRIDPELRDRLRQEWNTPVTWPVWALVLVLLLGLVPALVVHRRKTHAVGVLH